MLAENSRGSSYSLEDTELEGGLLPRHCLVLAVTLSWPRYPALREGVGGELLLLSHPLSLHAWPSWLQGWACCSGGLE